MTASTGKRRTRGTGSVRLKREPNGWEVRAPARNEAGNAIQISKMVYGTRREAERALREMQGEVDRGHHKERARTTEDLFVAWLEVVRTLRAPLTYRQYRSNVNHHILPALGKIPLEKLGAAEIDRFYVALASKEPPLAQNTIHLIHAVLHRGLDQGVRWGWLVTNPDDRTSPPAKKDSDLKPPTWGQIADLIQATEPHDPTLAMIVFVAALTGMRRGELAALRWSDLAAARVTVARGAVYLGKAKGTVVGDTKTHRVRTIGIADHLEAALLTHRGRMVARAATAGAELAQDAYVFSNTPSCSKPMRPDEITERFDMARRRIGHTYRLHDLRHFMGSWLVGRGVDVRTVSGRLGHKSAAMTLDVYGHFSAALDAVAATYTGELTLRAKGTSPEPPPDTP